MADMDFQLVLEAVVKGQDALDKLAKTEEQITKAAKAANDAQAATAGKAETAMKRESEAMQRAATAAKGLGAGANAASAASTRQATAAERVATAERRAADATKAHATAATQEAHAVQAAARAQTAATGGVARAAAVAVQQRRTARRQFMAEAASQATPYGYMLGAGAAVAGGAAVGIAAYAGYEASTRLARASVGEAISRETAFAEIQKKVNLDAGESWDTLDRKVAKVSTSIGMRYQDVAAIFAQGGQSGIAYKDLDTFGVLAAKVSTAWDVSAKEAAQMLAEVRAQTGKTIPDLEKFADKVNFLGDISAAAEKDIGNMYQRAAAGMAASGVGEDQSLAMMTALRGVGMQDEVASRFLTFFSGRLRTATSWKDGPLEALKAIGMTAKEVEMGMQTKPMETILKFLDKASHAKNVVGTMKGILGGEWFDEGLRFAQAAPEITRLLDALSKGGWKGSMQQALDIELGTTEAKIKKLTASVTDLMAAWAKPISKGLIDPAVEWATKKANEEREAIERSEKSRAAVKPKGLSIDEYENALGLNRAPPPVITKMPTMALTEGNTPHIAQTPGTGRGFGRSVLDVSQFAEDAKKVTGASGSAYDALQKLNTSVTPQVNIMNAIDALDTLEKKAAAAAAAVKAIGTLGVPGAPHAPSAPSAPLAPMPGKQSGLSTGIIHANGGLRPTHVAHGGTTVHYAPTIHVAGGDEKTFRQQLREHSREIASIVGDDRDRRGRLSFRETT